MYRILRITCCILAVLGAAAAIFVFAYTHWLWGLLVVGLTLAFGGLMLLFKQLEEKEELKKNPPPPEGDFITGKATDKENKN